MQNPPPNQQGYGTPYGTPPQQQAPLTPQPGGGGGPRDKCALGTDANIAAALGYPVGIIAIIMLVIEKQNRFVRFHAFQSLLYHVAAIVLFMVLGVLVAIMSAISSYLGLLGVLIPILWLVYFAGLLFLAYKAYQGETFKLPMISDMAQNFANK
jgi:uncharacterized membrane protein